MTPSVQALLMVPICPHTLNARPLILPSTEQIEIDCVRRQHRHDVQQTGRAQPALERSAKRGRGLRYAADDRQASGETDNRGLQVRVDGQSLAVGFLRQFEFLLVAIHFAERRQNGGVPRLDRLGALESLRGHLRPAQALISQGQGGQRHPVVGGEHRCANQAVQRAPVVALVQVHEAERMQGRDVVGIAADQGVADGLRLVGPAEQAQAIGLLQLIARLRRGGYRLLDSQFVIPHLASLGAIAVPRRRYLAMLADAVSREASFYRGDWSGDVLQSTSQTS